MLASTNQAWFIFNADCLANNDGQDCSVLTLLKECTLFPLQIVWLMAMAETIECLSMSDSAFL